MYIIKQRLQEKYCLKEKSARDGVIMWYSEFDVKTTTMDYYSRGGREVRVE